MEGVFASARAGADNGPKRFSQAAFFGTSGLSITQAQGRLYKLRASNKAASTKYFVQVFDKATAPVNNDVPIWEGQVAAGSDVEFNFNLVGLYCANGIGVALSTTGNLLTLAGADDASAFGLYTVQNPALP